MARNPRARSATLADGAADGRAGLGVSDEYGSSRHDGGASVQGVGWFAGCVVVVLGFYLVSLAGRGRAQASSTRSNAAIAGRAARHPRARDRIRHARQPGAARALERRHAGADRADGRAVRRRRAALASLDVTARPAVGPTASRCAPQRCWCRRLPVSRRPRRSARLHRLRRPRPSRSPPPRRPRPSTVLPRTAARLVKAVAAVAARPVIATTATAKAARRARWRLQRAAASGGDARSQAAHRIRPSATC